MTPENIASFFKQEFKPFAQSIFAIPPVEKIKEALVRNHIIHRKRAAAVYRISKSNTIHKDFAAREIGILKQDIVAHEFAAANFKDGVAVLNDLKKKAATNGVGCWIEVFEEHETSRKTLDQTGFIYIATKVSAFSDVRGIYAWWGPANRTRAIRSIPPMLEEVEYLTLALVRKNFLSAGEIKKIQDEINAYLRNNKMWADHYSNYNVRKSWTAFSLRGFKAEDTGFIIKPSEMMRRWKQENTDLLTAEITDTVAAKQFPFSMKVAARIPGRKERVRFMRLDPEKGELTRHADISDKFAGVRDGLVSRFHIPIKTCPECFFKAWDARGTLIKMRLKIGGLYYLDQRKPHAVLNACKTERIHFVVDTFMNVEGRRLLENGS